MVVMSGAAEVSSFSVKSGDVCVDDAITIWPIGVARIVLFQEGIIYTIIFIWYNSSP